ncbi:unnamed protein product [Ceratitis capitata]|uniref:(Mediterranean fruit fly) hypothetical protein n=1 Tax=Ceratitis capitata TaxID=7213 RepID=A0A811ULB7_CERCA|nr:unnamed protein product [Ceratitis capitata]
MKKRCQKTLGRDRNSQILLAQLTASLWARDRRNLCISGKPIFNRSQISWECGTKTSHLTSAKPEHENLIYERQFPYHKKLLIEITRRIQHNQNNSGLLCRSRRPEGAPSPTPSDTSDSDISLGTHSPVPSSIQLQHSPGSTSNGANDREESLSIDDDKPRDLATSIAASNLAAAATYATSTPLSTCLPPFKLDTATSLFNAGCYLQSFSNLKEMSQQFPIQPIVIRPQPQLPAQAHSLNGSHLHAAINYPPPAYAAMDCTPPKIRVNSPEKLNSTANSIAATLSTVAALQDTSAYQHHHHHSVQLLHRPFSTSPDVAHNNHNAAPPEIT